MRVIMHLMLQSEPIVHENVKNAYQKGDLYCVMFENSDLGVYKYPIANIFRILEIGRKESTVDAFRETDAFKEFQKSCQNNYSKVRL
jgi:hypothetical protein